MVSVAYSEAFVEVLAILDNSTQEEKSKIPKQFLEFLENNASKTYKVNFDTNKPMKELNLRKETKGIFSVIYYNYLCTPEKKQEYEQLLNENKSKYDEALREKYNPDNIFQNNGNTYQAVSNGQALTEYKPSLWSKIINKIKAIFKKV